MVWGCLWVEFLRRDAVPASDCVPGHGTRGTEVVTAGSGVLYDFSVVVKDGKRAHVREASACGPADCRTGGSGCGF